MEMTTQYYRLYFYNEYRESFTLDQSIDRLSWLDRVKLQEAFIAEYNLPADTGLSFYNISKNQFDEDMRGNVLPVYAI